MSNLHVWTTFIGSHLTREPTAILVLTKWWNWELMLATNFGSLSQTVTKVGSPNFYYQIWFCIKLIMYDLEETFPKPNTWLAVIVLRAVRQQDMFSSIQVPCISYFWYLLTLKFVAFWPHRCGKVRQTWRVKRPLEWEQKHHKILMSMPCRLIAENYAMAVGQKLQPFYIVHVILCRDLHNT